MWVCFEQAVPGVNQSVAIYFLCMFHAVPIRPRLIRPRYFPWNSHVPLAPETRGIQTPSIGSLARLILL